MKAKVLALAAFSVLASAPAAQASDSYYTTDFDAIIPRTSNTITPDDQARAAQGVRSDGATSRDGR